MHFEQHGTIFCYVDSLIGEIQFIDSNAVEKFNSLTNLNTPIVDINSCSLYSGSYISNKIRPQCMTCPVGTKRLYMFYTEPNIDDINLKGMWTMRVVSENGLTKLSVQLYIDEPSMGVNKFDNDLPATDDEHDVPYGEYILIKE